MPVALLLALALLAAPARGQCDLSQTRLVTFDIFAALSDTVSSLTAAVASTLPNFTAETRLKSVPVILTGVPPAVVPPVGVMAETTAAFW